MPLTTFQISQLKRLLSGEVRLDFRTDGLVCVIRTVVGAPL